MSILIKGIPLGGYEISIMKDGERYRARVDGIWCEVEEIPTTEPDTDTISRQAAIDVADAVWSVTGDKNVAKVWDQIKDLPSAQPEQRWISCSERLPEEDKEVLISYRYKEGEGDTSHTYIDITTYGQMYFGGNKVGNYKHWRAPFEYFESNYEVVAWMLLPEPYKEADDE